MNLKLKSLSFAKIISLTMIIILPFIFFGVAIMFHSEVKIDKPKFLEELAKALIVLFFLLLTRQLTRMDKLSKAKAVRETVSIQLKSDSELLEEILKLSYPVLKDCPVDELRVNNSKIDHIKLKVDRIKILIANTLSHIYRSDPEIAVLCGTEIQTLNEISSSIDHFNSSPQPESFKSIQKNLESLNSIIF